MNIFSVKIYSNLTKQEYHTLLAESKVMLSNTIEENFGYCIVESCIYKTAPICANKYSHPELLEYDRRLLFDDEDEIIEKIENALVDNQDHLRLYSSKYAFDTYKKMGKNL